MKRTKVLSLFLAATLLIPQSVFAEKKELNQEYDKYEQILNYAGNLYIDENVDTDSIIDAGIKAALKDNPELLYKMVKAGLESLDPYTEFYTKEEFELFNKNINNIVYGIGVIIQKVDDYITVMSVLDGGGAEEVGVKEGDKIAKVNGVLVKGESIEKVQDLVVGEIGTTVEITFLRGENEVTYTIERREVKGNTSASQILKGNIGYIRIVNFAADTDTEVADAVDEFEKQGVKKIIIDLRDNPGGYLESAVNIASLFVPKGLIVKTVYRSQWENKEYYSKLDKTKYDVAVLVNENTASAAEVLSSAIQDSKAGILIGDKTYGKGVIQQMYKIWDGCAFKITTGKYFTRNGKDINGNGIEPDEVVYNSTRRIDLSRYQTFDYIEKPQVGTVSKNVRAGKERLSALGYYMGSINDTFDEEFAKAVCTFQENNELFPYGVLDISTQVKMENLFYKLEEEVDDQLIFAYKYFGGNEEDLYSTEE